MTQGSRRTASMRGRAVVIAAAAAAALTACGGGPSTQAVHGKVIGGTQAAETTVRALGGGVHVCGGAVAGTQVIVKGPSGKLLATTTLHKDAKATAKLGLPAVLSGKLGQVGVYTFSTAIPAGNGPYTIDLVGVVGGLFICTRDHDQRQRSLRSFALTEA